MYAKYTPLVNAHLPRLACFYAFLQLVFYCWTQKREFHLTETLLKIIRRKIYNGYEKIY